VSPPGKAYFDHVAIAVKQWSDGYAALVTELGGHWVGGGSAGEFAPAQIGFAGDIKVELLQPGDVDDGFVTRFLERSGLGPHHLTFMVPHLDRFVAVATKYGLPVLGAFLEVPDRPETFVHPKASGFGTLIQAIQFSDLGPDPSPPQGFPTSTAPSHQVSWVAVRVARIEEAAQFLVEATDASVEDVEGDASSILLGWERGQHLLLLDGSGGAVGVDHIAFHLEGAASPSPRSVLAGGVSNQLVDAPGLRILVCR